MPTQPSDHELVDAWRGGDRKAGGELIDRHHAALHRFFANKVGRLLPQQASIRATPTEIGVPSRKKPPGAPGVPGACSSWSLEVTRTSS